MFLISLSHKAQSNPLSSFRHLFFIIIVAAYTDALVKKAIVEWSPIAEPFRDPMIDHAALVELQLLDRIVFVCEPSVPAVIYKVSEESFAECKYGSSSEWIGECSRERKYVTVSLRSVGVVPIQTVFYPNTTYFFTSFSSGTRQGLHDKRGGLCEMGVRLILEVRDSAVRVPVKPRSGTQFQEAQVPVQRVSYGGQPEKLNEQHFNSIDDSERPFTERSSISDRTEVDTYSYFTPDDENSNFLFGWSWFDSSPPRQILEDSTRVQKRRGNSDQSKWEPMTPEFFKYSAATTVLNWFMVALVLSLFYGL